MLVTVFVCVVVTVTVLADDAPEIVVVDEASEYAGCGTLKYNTARLTTTNKSTRVHCRVFDNKLLDSVLSV
jgi:archaeosine-15-forming tRNA-guanine transglycosylase